MAGARLEMHHDGAHLLIATLATLIILQEKRIENPVIGTQVQGGLGDPCGQYLSGF